MDNSVYHNPPIGMNDQEGIFLYVKRGDYPQIEGK
jgi:hypothetical protein